MPSVSIERAQALITLDVEMKGLKGSQGSELLINDFSVLKHEAGPEC